MTPFEKVSQHMKLYYNKSMSETYKRTEKKKSKFYNR
jgi:hypothetical protein